jgi:hypothetical protein
MTKRDKVLIELTPRIICIVLVQTTEALKIPKVSRLRCAVLYPAINMTSMGFNRDWEDLGFEDKFGQVDKTYGNGCLWDLKER